MDITPYQLNDRYSITTKIAEGGMSVLYSGRDIKEDRVVAIKSMRPYDFVSEVKRARFLHEIRVTSQLKHPNIVDLLDSGEDSEGAPYLVMELLEGRNLQDELDSRDPVPPQEALVTREQ